MTRGEFRQRLIIAAVAGFASHDEPWTAAEDVVAYADFILEKAYPQIDYDHNVALRMEEQAVFHPNRVVDEDDSKSYPRIPRSDEDKMFCCRRMK